MKRSNGSLKWIFSGAIPLQDLCHRSVLIPENTAPSCRIVYIAFKRKIINRVNPILFSQLYNSSLAFRFSEGKTFWEYFSNMNSLSILRRIRKSNIHFASLWRLCKVPKSIKHGYTIYITGYTDRIYFLILFARTFISSFILHWGKVNPSGMYTSVHMLNPYIKVTYLLASLSITPFHAFWKCWKALCKHFIGEND